MRFLAPVLVMLSLAACSVQADRPITSYEKVNKVEFVRFEHNVMYHNGDLRPTPAEQERLNAFLRDIQAGNGDTIYVTGGSPKQRRKLGAQLASRRLDVKDGGKNGTPGRIHVSVERYIVTPPTCPDWSKAMGGDSQNTPGVNFGCATTSNLGMMVANPRDLIRGQEPGASDGAAVSGAIQRYRAGKTRELNKENFANTFRKSN